MLVYLFLGRKWVRAFGKDIQVTISDDRAEVSLVAILVGGQDVKTLRDVLPRDATAYALELKLVKRDGDFLVSYARYKRVAPGIALGL